MKHRSVLSGFLVLALSSTAGAETAIKEPSCVDVVNAASWYQACVNWFGASYCTRPAVSQCWDFEAGLAGGSFGAWTASGAAFTNQPTYGDNVAAWRALQTQWSGNRTFDLNYDGLAHYGMLPDLLQDTRVVGMTNEQLGPLFQGAEALVETWEKSCSLSNAGLNALGCR